MFRDDGRRLKHDHVKARYKIAIGIHIEPTGLRLKVMPMTPYLIAAREGMIWWVTLTMIPVEIVFDAIEDELNRRGRSP